MSHCTVAFPHLLMLSDQVKKGSIHKPTHRALMMVATAAVWVPQMQNYQAPLQVSCCAMRLKDTMLPLGQK